MTIKGDDALRFHLDEPIGRIQAGERILFRLENIAVGAGMAHNALVTRKDDAVAIGEAADATLTDPKAFQHGYVPLYIPELKKKILAYSTLVQPGEHTEFLWKADKPGVYTVICTFPGHWRIMQFDVEVVSADKKPVGFPGKGSLDIDEMKKRKDLSFLEGDDGKPYVHFFAAEAEYGAFYSMPMLAEILNKRYGFTVSVSYALDAEGHIDSRVRDGLKGFDLLEHADLVVFFSRGKALTKATSQQVQQYLDSGKPIVGFRTANHGFTFLKESSDADYLYKEGWTHKGPKLCDMWKHKFGGHHGGSHKDGYLTSISLGEQPTAHPIVNGFTPYKDPRHLYILLKEPGEDQHDFKPLVYGEALKIYDHKAHLPKTQPTVVISETARRMVYSSTCGADTFLKEPARRLAIQGMFWALGLEDEIPKAGLNVEVIRPYDPPHDTHLRPDDPHRGFPMEVFK